jgi:hypothetical protein
MKKLNYLITYQVLNIKGGTVKAGTMRCKNRTSEFDAKVNLEKHLKTKHTDFHSMVVTKCELDIDPYMADKFFDLFKNKDKGSGWFDQFLKNNPLDGI